MQRVSNISDFSSKADIKSEWVFPVTGLPVPQGIGEKELNQSSALALFVERARQANVEFKLCDADKKSAIRICRLVDGMPLGIELAAAWTTVLSPREIIVEIQKSIDFLSSSKRDENQRHACVRLSMVRGYCSTRACGII
jgi:predicted ATPase